MVDQSAFDSHYWPGEGCIPLTPQARRVGWTFPVYVTREIWSECITWTPDKKSNPDKRIYELLESCWLGMGKALSSEPDRIHFPFKHWYWARNKPKATKKKWIKAGARLILDPDTEEPWILIFDPLIDGKEVLRGKPEENRENDGIPGDPQVSGVSGDDPGLDLGPEAVRDLGPEQ